MIAYSIITQLLIGLSVIAIVILGIIIIAKLPRDLFLLDHDREPGIDRKASAEYRQARGLVIAEERKERLAQLETEVFAPITIETILNDPDWTNLTNRKEPQ